MKTCLAERQVGAAQAKHEELKESTMEELALLCLAAANLWELTKPSAWQPQEDDLLSALSIDLDDGHESDWGDDTSEGSFASDLQCTLVLC